MALIIGNGSTVSYAGTAIANITSISLETSVADISFQTLDANTTIHRGGVQDATFTLEAFYDPDNTEHAAIDTDTLGAALETGAAIVITLTDGTPTTFSFTGLVTSASRNASVNAGVTLSISGVVSGAITKA